MVDKILKNLQHKVQIKLKKVNSWLCQNKLSLNFSTTNCIIVNKQPRKTCQCNFRIALNGVTINRAHIVKYLGLFIHDNLKWTSQINYLSTQLARCIGFFYRLRSFASRETFCMLYYSLVYKRIHHGITAWETQVGAIPHLCIVERNSPKPAGWRLSLTYAGLGKNILDGAVLTSAMNEWSREVLPRHICSICIPPRVLY